jgi:hypothetical protein
MMKQIYRDIRSIHGWPHNYSIFIVHPIPRHHWKMYGGGIFIQRKRMHTWLERWHNVFWRRNGIRTYFAMQLV